MVVARVRVAVAKEGEATEVEDQALPVLTTIDELAAESWPRRWKRKASRLGCLVIRKVRLTCLKCVASTPFSARVS